jgi:AraC-like DNA-binding protein
MESVEMIRHESAVGRWETALRGPHPAMHGYVGRYAAYREYITGFSSRRETPGGWVPMIVSLGAPISIAAPGSHDSAATPFRAFVAGMHDTFAISECDGEQAGVQVSFTPMGARAFFGVPMCELTNRAFEVEDVMGSEGRVLVERLRSARTWEDCFEILDVTIAGRMAKAPSVPRDVAWALEQIANPGGPVRIRDLAASLGYSHKHLIARFREEVGLAPRGLARVLRFERTLERLKAHAHDGWATIALDSGYYDQAHMYRDFRDFTGFSPSEFLRRMVADNGGIVDEW